MRTYGENGVTVSCDRCGHEAFFTLWRHPYGFVKDKSLIAGELYSRDLCLDCARELEE